METTTETTPEMKNVATASVNEKNTSQVDQQQIESNKQEKSFIRILYPRSEWNDTLELLGCIFLTIIISVVSCELIRFCIQHLLNTPSDAFLYRYQCVLCVMILIIIILILIVVFVGSIHVLSLATESIFFVLVKYYYVEGKTSYKWWQKKTSIQFIIISIMLLIWFVIVIELGYSAFTNLNERKLPQDRSFFYQFFGFLITLCSSLIFLIASSENKSVRALMTEEIIQTPLN